jgi:hypothetical protein
MPIAITTGKFSAEAVRGMMSKPEDRAMIISKLAEAAGGKLASYK